MNLPVSVNTLGSLVTAGLGVYGLFWPLGAAKLVGISPVDEKGVSEIRATYGGLFLALGIFATIAQTHDIFRCVAIGWIGAGAARAFSYVRDNSRSGANLGAIVVELIVGMSMLVPWDSFFGT
ncbi:MAG TPA: DUF4345 family protein [Candidatus Binatia bacterium]